MVPAAFAVVGFGVTPTFPSTVTVGQQGLPASLQILNASNGLEAGGNVTLNAINLAPTCGTTASVGNGNCPASQADPGVFSLSATGTGEAGTACAGKTFTIQVIDPATGQVTFTPNTPVTLTPPATANSVCRIDFTFDVLKSPTHPVGTPAPNTVTTAQIAFAFATADDGSTGIGSGSGVINVDKAQPSITTTATATANVGGPITDTATLSAATPPGPAHRDHHLHRLRPQRPLLRPQCGVHGDGSGGRQRRLPLRAVHAHHGRDLQLRGRLQRRLQQCRGDQSLQRLQ